MALERPDELGEFVLMSGYCWPTLRLDAPLVSGPAIPLVGDISTVLATRNPQPKPSGRRQVDQLPRRLTGPTSHS